MLLSNEIFIFYFYHFLFHRYFNWYLIDILTCIRLIFDVELNWYCNCCSSCSSTAAAAATTSWMESSHQMASCSTSGPTSGSASGSASGSGTHLLSGQSAADAVAPGAVRSQCQYGYPTTATTWATTWATTVRWRPCWRIAVISWRSRHRLRSRKWSGFLCFLSLLSQVMIEPYPRLPVSIAHHSIIQSSNHHGFYESDSSVIS